MSLKEKLIIGGREKIKLTRVSRNRVYARIDTGAKSSSVHCTKFWLEKKHGKEILYAAILNKNHLMEFHQFKIKKIKSSNGISEKRYIVTLQFEIGNHQFSTEFTLSNRKKMQNPVLLGRKFLRGHFLVDVARKNVLSAQLS
jgi:hypothetical protein